jgi:reticulon-4-interacting protein 1, mitochondrial
MEKAVPSLPATMLAWTHCRAGPPSVVLSLSTNVKTPTVKKPTDIVVRVGHAALNPAGSIVMQLCPFLFRSKPSIPEADFAGEVVAAGSAALESGRISVGDAVFGSINTAQHIRAGSGSLAEFVRVDMADVTKKPGIHATEAETAGLGIAGCTAVVLMEKSGLKQGNSVLVNGASGGIGSMVVQMARDEVGVNGRVIAICSGSNAELVKQLGADGVSLLILSSTFPFHAPAVFWSSMQWQLAEIFSGH